MSFVHLHVHSHFSLLDGLPKIPELVGAAKAYNMPAIALTDHGSLYGALEFYQAAHKENVKPIIGAELYLSKNRLHLKRPKIDDQFYHLLLLAQNKEGYRNLLTLSTIGHLDGFYYRPRIDKTALRKHASGLICLSGCFKGEISQALVQNDLPKAEGLISEYQDIFGRDNFYIELQRHNPKDPDKARQELTINNHLIELARARDIPMVATNDSHYLRPTDAHAQDALICIQTGKTIDEPNRLSLMGFDLSFASPDIMRQKFSDIPEAIENTLEIAEKCNLTLELGNFYFPAFPLPKNTSADVVLREQSYKGLEEKCEAPLTEEQKDRLNYELDIIKQKGYPTYFLIVADFVNWARNEDIVTTTRGSAAGSLVSYAIGITTLNPLDYNLPFERFLNPERPNAPDIDVDLADDKRDTVIQYVTDKYGTDKVAKIVTFGTMLARAAVRDVTRALDLPYALGDKVAKQIPMGAQGFPMTIEKAIDLSPELKSMYDNDTGVKKIIDLAQKIEGCARHASVHAAGVVIGPTTLTDFIPLQKESRRGRDIVTQYDMHASEAAGLVKIDFLGIRNLSILGLAIKIVTKTKDVKVDLEQIPLDDEKTFTVLAAGETMGLFQLGGSGMTRYLRELKPTSIHDIMAMVALYRPGPMDSIPEYIKRKHGKSPVRFLDDKLRPILEKSYGILVYQDDVLLIAIQLAGYSWLEADKLRKAMGKKIPEEMAAQKEKFISGCQKKSNLTTQKAGELWKLIEPFAAYGFNKAHAASYGRVAYQTAYMKAHYPAEFMAAVMTAESANAEKVAEAVKECTKMGIKVLPPDVQSSRPDFTFINDTEIRFGLAAIKNLGNDVIAYIISERKSHGPYESISDFLKRTSTVMNKKALESLVKSGALDELGDRSTVYANLDRMLSYARKHQKEIKTKQSSLFGALEQEASGLHLVDTEPIPKNTRLSWEKELLGLYVSDHPLANLVEILPKACTPIDQLGNTKEKRALIVVVSEVERKITKKGDYMAFASAEDTTGSLDLIVFPDSWRTLVSILEPEAIVYIEGSFSKRDGDAKFIVETAHTVTKDLLERLSAQPIQSTTVTGTAPEKHPKYPGGVTITLPSAYNPHLNKQLKNIFEKSAGPTKVRLAMHTENASKTIDTNFHITYTDNVRNEIESLVGKKAIAIQE